MPEVTVIIPAYNAAATIAAALASLADQQFRDFTAIVVDDGSADNTAELAARAFPHVTVLRQSNAGPAAARNRAAAAARSPWLAFLDADDQWLPWRLAVQLEAARRYPQVALWSADHVGLTDAVPTPAWTDPGFWAEDRVTRLCRRDFLVSNPIGTVTTLLQRSVFENVGGFDPRFRGPEDYDLWMRIAAVTEAAHLRCPVARYCERQGSLSLDDQRFLPEVIRVLDKAYGPGGALRGVGCRAAAVAYQYASASWMAYCRGDRRRARHLLLRSLLHWPLPLGGTRKSVALRTRLLWRYTIRA